MYLTAEILEQALGHLQQLHPFFGITYPVCKKGRLPVGRAVRFPINREEQQFLENHYRPDPDSKHYFQPLKTSVPGRRWLSPKYASSGSQSTRTRGHLSKAFIHRTDADTDQWGWAENYIDVLKEQLRRDRVNCIPAFWLAVWLFRDRKWPSTVTGRRIVDRLYEEFCIGGEERERLFDGTAPQDMGGLLQEMAIAPGELLKLIPAPPDAKPEGGGALRLLELRGVGPSRALTFEPGERLTVVTGDNGLGKSFLLECAWWSLTGVWAESAANPRPNAGKEEPRITFSISASNRGMQKTPIHYDWETQSWGTPKTRPTIPGMIVYARVDGSFAVWDPVRHEEVAGPSKFIAFRRDEVLNGLPHQIEGLLRDWVKWQHSPDRTIFETFSAVLQRLSPPDLGPLVPAEPMRIPGDIRDMPALAHSYGVVPFVNESAGVKRILTLAYLLVWAWNEHIIASAQAKRAPQKRFVILMDEIEAHLHPKWQREILPAVLDVTGILAKRLEPQVIVTTHSPLILASLESVFRPDTDRLCHLHVSGSGDVTLADMPFVRLGRVDEWLTSDVFELKEARSREAETTLEGARRVLEEGGTDRGEIMRITHALREVLSSDDIFWQRWVYFAKRNGVTL